MKIELHYQGPAVDRGRMSASDLGPAIFSVAKAVEHTTRVLYGDQGRVAVEVDADFERASFGLEFFLGSPGGGLLPALDWGQLANIVTVLGFGGAASKSVIDLIRWVRKRKIDEVRQGDDGVAYRIKDESITVSYNVHDVYNDPHVRAGIDGMVEPLRRPGVDALEIQADRFEPERILRDEVHVFKAPTAPEEVLNDRTSTEVLEVVSPAFKDGYKWKFAQGDHSYFANVLDGDFLDRVSRRDVVFGKGDALLVEMQVLTTRKGREYCYDRNIIRVLEHIRAPNLEQGRLDL